MAEKEWFSASELAGLPGMPGSARVVRLKAQKEDWTYREATCRGGTRREHHLSILPPQTQEHLRSTSDRADATELPEPEITGEINDDCCDIFPSDCDLLADVSVGTGIAEESPMSEAIESTSIYKEAGWWVEPPIEITQEAEIKRQTWLAILGIYEQWRENCNLSTVVEEDTVFAGLYTRGEIEVPKWIRSKIRTLSRATLAAKRIAYKGKQSKALANKRADRPKF
jgi:hypothetical protein